VREVVSPSEAAESQKHVVIIVPVGIPGMGKTTLIECLIKGLNREGAYCLKVSSDEIKRAHMDKYRAQHKSTEEEAFHGTQTEAAKAFFVELGKATTRVMTAKEKLAVLFLDRNHPPETLDKTIDTIKEKELAGVRVTKLALVPEIKNQQARNPLSLTFFL